MSTLLDLGVAGAIGTGTSALIQDKNYQALHIATDADNASLEQSISHLQECLSSLAEVVFHNRRGLDQQGGLCAALHDQRLFLCKPFGSDKRLYGPFEKTPP